MIAAILRGREICPKEGKPIGGGYGVVGVLQQVWVMF